MVVCTVLLIAGCGNKEPFAPDSKELVQDEQHALLGKASDRIITTWEGYELKYEQIDPGEEWMEDGVLHVRGRIIRDRLETDNVRVTGFLTVNYDYDLNVATGGGTMTSTWSVDPDEYEGTWGGRSLIEFTNFILTGDGIGRGYGEFQGIKITVSFNGAPPPYDKIPVSGYIIEKP
jgi:hypothetical protein